MGRVVVPPNDIPARNRPDGSVQAIARISAGTELIEVERLGDWARVTTPDSTEFWVDARRLAPIDTAPEAEPILDATLPEEQAVVETTSDEPPSGKTHRKPWLAASVILVIAAASAAWFLFVRDTGDSHSTAISDPPTVIKGWIDLGFEPVSVLTGETFAYFSYVLGEDRIMAVRPPLSSEKLTDVDTLYGSINSLTDVLRPRAVTVPFALDHLVVLDGIDSLTALAVFDLSRHDFDESTRPQATITDEVAPFISPQGDLDSEVLVLFGIDAGLANRMLTYNAKTLEPVDEYPLPQPVNIMAVGSSPGRLYVGHSDGLLIFDTWAMPQGPPSLLRSLDFSTVSLAAGFSNYVGNQIMLALDAEGEAILVLDSGSGGDNPVIGAVDLVAATGGSREYTQSLAAIGHYAYVLTSEGDLLVIDVSPSENIDAADRLVAVVEGLGASSLDNHRLIQLDTTWGMPNRGVLVTDPERQRLWWISSGVPDGRYTEIPLVIEEP